MFERFKGNLNLKIQMIKLCLVSKHKWIKKFVNFIMEIAKEEKMTFEICWNKNELQIRAIKMSF